MCVKLERMARGEKGESAGDDINESVSVSVRMNVSTGTQQAGLP